MIILVYGLPGTGKSHFSKHFAKETGAVHLNTDIVRDKLNFKGQYDEKTKQQVYNELVKQAKMELKNGSDTIVEGTFHKKDRRKQIERMGAETNQKVYLIEIKANEDTVKKRMKRKRKYSEADFNVYQKIKESFEPVGKSHLELWSDNENTEEMMEKAKQYIDG